MVGRDARRAPDGRLSLKASQAGAAGRDLSNERARRAGGAGSAARASGPRLTLLLLLAGSLSLFSFFRPGANAGNTRSREAKGGGAAHVGRECGPEKSGILFWLGCFCEESVLERRGLLRGGHEQSPRSAAAEARARSALRGSRRCEQIPVPTRHALKTTRRPSRHTLGDHNKQSVSRDLNLSLSISPRELLSFSVSLSPQPTHHHRRRPDPPEEREMVPSPPRRPRPYSQEEAEDKPHDDAAADGGDAKPEAQAAAAAPPSSSPPKKSRPPPARGVALCCRPTQLARSRLGRTVLRRLARLGPREHL